MVHLGGCLGGCSAGIRHAPEQSCHMYVMYITILWGAIQLSFRGKARDGAGTRPWQHKLALIFLSSSAAALGT
jgi:hypothetical protein